MTLVRSSLVAIERALAARQGRREGRELRFLCPAHPDRHPSARWNPDKRTWCCDSCKQGGGWRDLAERLGLDMVPAGDLLDEVEAVYDYRDAEGGLRFQVLRKRGKSFVCRRPLPAGGWAWNLAGVERLLYRLPETLAASRAGALVFVVEGEKDADRLAALGLAATTNPGGAGKWLPHYGTVLQDARAVLLPDHDAAGRSHAEMVGASLAGIAAEVRLLELPGLPEKGDVSDWLDAGEREGHTAGEMRHELERLAAAAAPARRRGSTAVEPADPVEAALAGLAATTGAETAGEWLRRLGDALRGAGELPRSLARERAMAALRGKMKAPARCVDAALAVRQPPAAGRGGAVELAVPELWPVAVDGATLLGDVATTFGRFVALPRLADAAAALWTVHAHALEAAGASPLLALTSPEKRCGKTTTLALLSRLVPRPLLSSNITAASLFRVVDKYSPTLLADEADSFLRDKEELRGILNSGHTRDAAFVVRTVGDEHEPHRFSTWAAKAVAMIGKLPDTLADRSIVIPMRRRTRGEQVERLRLDRPGDFEELRRRAARWAADHLAELRAADPEVPGELGDRAADNWRPLLAIADLAGAEWPQRARRAAVALSSNAAEERASVGEELLGDIREAFRKRAGERIFTEELLAELRAREDRPWGEWRRGQAMSAAQLARQLRPFGIRPRLYRDGAKCGRGYSAEDFADTFARYLPADSLPPLQVNEDAGLAAKSERYAANGATDRKSGANASGTGVVTDVTSPDPEEGWVKV